jgi:hypothetical protein
MILGICFIPRMIAGIAEVRTFLLWLTSSKSLFPDRIRNKRKNSRNLFFNWIVFWLHYITLSLLNRIACIHWMQCVPNSASWGCTKNPFIFLPSISRLTLQIDFLIVNFKCNVTKTKYLLLCPHHLEPWWSGEKLTQSSFTVCALSCLRESLWWL